MAIPIYMDYAAATPLDERVLAAMEPYFISEFYNPSATYLAGKTVHDVVETARSEVAAILGVRQAEIIFTAGGTEANNLALHGVLANYPGKKVLVSSVEHASILDLAHHYDGAEIPVLPDGSVDLGRLKNVVENDTVLVSVQYANNEVGTIQPLRQIAVILENVRASRRAEGNSLPLYFHTDATQAANYLDLHTSRLGVDLLTLNGGKIYGPKQTGVLYVRSSLSLTPLIYGGGQERALRSGTENVPGIVGFATALALAQQLRRNEAHRLGILQELCIELLKKRFPTVLINGSLKHRLPNNVHCTIPGQDNERLLMALDDVGIMAAAGSACAASDEEPSHVLQAMGLSADDARASLRFTMGRSTTEQDVRTVVDELGHLVA